MRIIGIDPGTKCGYAWTDDGVIRPAQSGVWDLRPRRHEGGGMRYVRVRNYLAELLVGRTDSAVFYEEVRAHRGTDAAHVYGGIVSAITALCEEMHVPYQGIPVGTIKKRATGRGNANKETMIEAANTAFGFAFGEPVGEITDDNQADALWILQVGLEELGIE